MLPQRRNRIWGFAYLLTGDHLENEVQEDFRSSLRRMRSNFQFGIDVIFQHLPEMPVQKRHQELIQKAKLQAPLSDSLFVDCASSSARLTFGDGVLPCVTPKHPIYSTKMRRYLNKLDFCQAQGLWESCFNEIGYKTLLSMDAQDVAGNAFSSTVCQAVVMCMMTLVPSTWQMLEDQPPKLAAQSSQSSQLPLRRLKRKQPAPNFMPPEKAGKAQNMMSHKRRTKLYGKKYKRKVPGKDLRKESIGKRKTATIWDKEQVMLGIAWQLHLVFGSKSGRVKPGLTIDCRIHMSSTMIKFINTYDYIYIYLYTYI